MFLNIAFLLGRSFWWWWYWGLNSALPLSHTSNLFCSVYFGDRVFPSVQTSLNHDPPSLGFPPSLDDRLTGVYHHTQLLVEMAVSLTFCLSWPGTAILPISASQIARIKVWATSSWLHGKCLKLLLLSKRFHSKKMWQNFLRDLQHFGI
jgi:hypothetical protein